MRASDLHRDEVLSFDGAGMIRFGESRVIVHDATALGLLRKELIEDLGANGARMILTRFGFAHGWRTAENLRRDFPWDSEEEWRHAGGALLTMLGHGVVDRTVGDGNTERPLVDVVVRDSYEAEQHLLHVGQSDAPVCWSLSGFVSGYLSFCRGDDVYARETRCRGKGDAVCHFVAQPREVWGDAIAEDLAFYQRESLDAALASIAETLKTAERQLQRHVRTLHSAASDSEDPSGIVAASEAMKRTLDRARRFARVDSSVLVTGESGVGKERIARLIHDESERTAGPFVAVNCAAVTETLLESELFGHARGSFTGATQDRPGFFEAANRGTIFLDEIGEIPASMQVKLLRVLQEQEVRRVGENRSRKVDVRVLAATNRELAQEVAAGRFRDDLYYRLRVVEIRIPPLRERRQDILPLARRTLTKVSRRLGRPMQGFTPAAADQLLRYSWPGNVRELQNAIEHAIVLADGPRVDAADLPEEVRLSVPKPSSSDLTLPLAEIERQYTLAVLESNDGNRSRTAQQLGIGEATLYRKLRAYAK
ncbi:MAG: sigma 54-interacting transcriptional regulator [Thermoanaerobaculia bacterium]|nr:sigma 54-interacting transcriptional regulator [Thermoanaerobaculia bacterium]